MTRERFPPLLRLCGTETRQERVSPLLLHLCVKGTWREWVSPSRHICVWRKHDGRGFPPFVASVWNRKTTGEGSPSRCICVKQKHDGRGFPPSRCVCVWRKHDGRGFPPPCRVCVEQEHDRRGFPPSRCVCVWRKHDGRGFPPPLILSVWKRNMTKGFPPSHHVCLCHCICTICWSKPWGSEMDDIKKVSRRTLYARMFLLSLHSHRCTLKVVINNIVCCHGIIIGL